MKVRKELGKARARTRTVRSDSEGKAHPPWSEPGMVHFRVGGRTVIRGQSHSIYYTQGTQAKDFLSIIQSARDKCLYFRNTTRIMLTTDHAPYSYLISMNLPFNHACNKQFHMTFHDTRKTI